MSATVNEGEVVATAMTTSAPSSAAEASEAPRRDEPTTVTVASQATLPPEQRTYGPLLVWGGAAKQTPYLLFRPLRFTLDDQMQVKRVQVEESASDSEADSDPDAAFAADFMLMCSTLGPMIDDLRRVLNAGAE